MSFSCDGQTLASASYDDTIKLWNLNLDSLMAKSCDLVRGYLTHNPNVSESDKHLCEGIGTKRTFEKSLPISETLILSLKGGAENPILSLQLTLFKRPLTYNT